MKRIFKSIKSRFPIKNIENGIIETTDGGYCKILEIFPINFELKSDLEKEAIIAQYKAFLKTCNFDMQIMMQSKKNDLEDHIQNILKIAENENSEKISGLIKEYINMINEKTIKTTVTRRFFIVFRSTSGKKSKEAAIDELKEKTTKIVKTLERCGNGVKDFSDSNFKIINDIYKQLNRKTSEIQNIEVGSYEKY